MSRLTSPKVVQEVVVMLKTTNKSCQFIADHFALAEWYIGELSRTWLTKEERRSRKVAQDVKNKSGVGNPMRGRTGFLHHNSTTGVTRCMGYKTVFTPDWWEGPVGKDGRGRIYEHHYVYCSAYDMKKIPKGFVIHHIDQNIDNNTLENLQLLSISEHIKLHWRLRKAQRLSSNGVGNSVPEAHGTPCG
jgi:hypothetical protein